MRSGEQQSLFETRKDRTRHIRRLYTVSVFVATCFVWAFRLTHIPANGEARQWAWFSLFLAELWSGIYWLFYQVLRWNMVFRTTFPNILSERYESRLPGVDIFVFTADAVVEPPLMVINTVLSVMAYDYPAQKLSVYVSDDGCSEITFYALLEASSFAKHWVPFCKRFKLEPRSPAAFFNNTHASTKSHDHIYVKHLATIRKLYEEMKRRVEDATKLGVPSEARSKHNGFSQWENSYTSRRDHDTILQIVLHKNDLHGSKDEDGCILPTLVYMAREKRPQYHSHYKAGAINSLLRISSKISRGKIILFLDCDMYSTNSQSVRDVLCFFMDEHKGQRIGYVQLPQYFDNIGQNDLYGNALSETMQIHLHGEDGLGGPLCIGTCCFFRRDALCGKKFNNQEENGCNDESEKEVVEVNMQRIEEEGKALASCTYEKNTLWGKKIGSIYGSLVEDVVTGLWIQSQGWKSVYCNPSIRAFSGIAPTNLLRSLVQLRRWGEGQLQILFSEFRPKCYGHNKVKLGLQLGYLHYNTFAITSLSVLYYSIIPPLYLLKGISFFPKMCSLWFIPFACVIVGEIAYSLIEGLSKGGSIKGWCNGMRMWLYVRSSSFLFSLLSFILGFFGRSNSSFLLTSKVTEDDLAQRYEKEIMEFGTSSPYFTVLATVALLNLFCLLSTLKDLVLEKGAFVEKMALQVLLCGFLVFINFPLYEAILIRKDKGRMPTFLSVKSTTLAFTACVFFKLFN
ncbi:cellulose synthase-like protein E1 isoform X2 [Vigna angularis]|uniref:cellulose synthase-like protein E1 isoform X2 n=1 Tax=Phaseolus angularis TaxID=3914 RepID=UPI0022B3C393|nr:cellulose synthase-like protein E1 isoform X2 [Vigna angularis]